VRAATIDAAGGSAYNLANDFDVRWREFYKLAGVGLGRAIHTVSVSPSVARIGLKAIKKAVKLVTAGGMNVVTTASLDFMARDNPFTSDRARREIGWNPRLRPEVGIPDAFRWWSEHR
jgi:nucleoside-diphosphate-sugar epimerase